MSISGQTTGAPSSLIDGSWFALAGRGELTHHRETRMKDDEGAVMSDQLATTRAAPRSSERPPKPPFHPYLVLGIALVLPGVG